MNKHWILKCLSIKIPQTLHRYRQTDRKVHEMVTIYFHLHASLGAPKFFSSRVMCSPQFGMSGDGNEWRKKTTLICIVLPGLNYLFLVLYYFCGLNQGEESIYRLTLFTLQANSHNTLNTMSSLSLTKFIHALLSKVNV